MTIRYLDVCSGYSAFTLGAEGLGFRCVGYSEIEAFPRAILEQRHHAVPVEWDHRFVAGSNTTPLFGDFTKIEAHHVGPVDLLTGGTPCQAFSVAGKRLGLDDPRGNLTLEFLALARRVRAPWLVWENVPGFLSHDGGRTMGTFLRLLGDLGYGWAYRVLDAQYIRVDGCERAVPQRRRRLFVVAHLGDAAGPAAVLFERESLRGDPAPRRKAGESAAGAAARSVALRGREDGGTAELGDDLAFALRASTGGGDKPHVAVASVTSTLPAGGNSTGGDRQPGTSAETAATMLIAQPLAASLTRGAESAGKGGYAGRRQEDDVNLVTHSLRAEGFDASEDGTGRGTPLVPVYAIQERAVCDNPLAGPQGSGVRADGAAYTLEARHHVQAVAFAQNSRDEVRLFGDDGQTVGALAAEPGMKQTCYVADQWAVRRLTPTECERLMGVPDGFTAITYRGKPAADGPRYKALGNSQARNCMRWLARGLIDVVTLQAAAAEQAAA